MRGNLLGRGHISGNVWGACYFFEVRRLKYTEPHVCLNVILRHTQAISVQSSKVMLGAGRPPLGSLPIPLRGLGIVLRHTPAQMIDEAQVVLGRRIALLSGPPIPLYGLDMILTVMLVPEAELVLGNRKGPLRRLCDTTSPPRRGPALHRALLRTSYLGETGP